MLQNVFKDSLLLVHVFVCVFGIASWIDLNGIWVELPHFVTVLPEAWGLPSFMIIIAQVANIGPLILVIVTYVWKEKRLESKVSFLIITIGLIACVLLAFFWHKTTYVAGELHSTALLTLNFMLAIVDCTSSIAFLAFMSSLKPQYMLSYFIGEGFSGMIPSLTALAQGTGEITCVNGSTLSAAQVNGTWHNETTYTMFPVYKEPRFSVKVFFFIVAGMMLCSLLSFSMLKCLPYCKSEFVEKHITSNSAQNQEITKSTYLFNEQKIEMDMKSTQTSYLAVLLFLIVWINLLLSSFLLSVQSYSCLPYGIDTFHLTVTLTNIANPLACFTAMFVSMNSMTGITFLTFIGSLFASYIIAGAVMSPTPVLVLHASGGGVMITVWVLCFYLLTYAKVAIANVLRRGGRRPLILCGAFTQIGSFIGALLGYILINIYHLFTSAPSC